MQTLHSHVPAGAARALQLGRFAPTNQLNLAIGLPLRNREGLTILLAQIYDPRSPNFHHFLTSAEFAQRFGPTEADYQSVIDFMTNHGLTVTAKHPNRSLLDVRGRVAEVERVFHFEMRLYQHPEENRTFYAPNVEPSLNLDVPILSIGGLNNYSIPRPRLHAMPMASSQNASANTGSGPTNGAYMGNDFRAAYFPGAYQSSVSLIGSGESVGLLQFDGYTAADITYYERVAGLPNITLSNVLIDGADGTPSGSGGEVEVSLDIEMAISMAPGLSKVILYMAPNPSPWEDILTKMAEDNAARQLSCSWGGGGPNDAAEQAFLQMAAQGQSFFTASGDDDAFTGPIPFPGDDVNVTVVGGTTLTTSGPLGAWVSEKAWNWGYVPRYNAYIGTGGGVSTYYAIPSWQAAVDMTANQGSTTMRNTPDVAMVADNVYVRADGRNIPVGGTSCAAPLWAGFTALINQQAAANGMSPVGFLNPAIYGIGTGPNYTSVFHDITVGNNTSAFSPTEFYAVTGYDLCTGWGTPEGKPLVDALLGSAAP